MKVLTTFCRKRKQQSHNIPKWPRQNFASTCILSFSILIFILFSILEAKRSCMFSAFFYCVLYTLLAKCIQTCTYKTLIKLGFNKTNLNVRIKQSSTQGHSPEGVLLKKLGRGVRPASQNPNPIYDQNLPYLIYDLFMT